MRIGIDLNYIDVSLLSRIILLISLTFNLRSATIRLGDGDGKWNSQVQARTEIKSLSMIIKGMLTHSTNEWKSTGQNLPSSIVACVQSTVHPKNLLLYLEIRVSCISFYSIFIVFQSYILSYYFFNFITPKGYNNLFFNYFLIPYFTLCCSRTTSGNKQ